MRKLNVKYRKILYISIAVIFLILFYLYTANIIFVRYVEHGLLVNKIDKGNYFEYGIYINGKLYNFVTKGKRFDLDRSVINFKSRGKRIVEFIDNVPPLNEKIMSRGHSSIEFEYSGYISISKEHFVYKQSGQNTQSKGTGSIIVGSDNVSVYKDRKGSI